jgi:hypothetical protein
LARRVRRLARRVRRLARRVRRLARRVRYEGWALWYEGRPRGTKVDHFGAELGHLVRSSVPVSWLQAVGQGTRESCVRAWPCSCVAWRASSRRARHPLASSKIASAEPASGSSPAARTPSRFVHDARARRHGGRKGTTLSASFRRCALAPCVGVLSSFAREESPAEFLFSPAPLLQVAWLSDSVGPVEEGNPDHAYRPWHPCRRQVPA